MSKLYMSFPEKQSLETRKISFVLPIALADTGRDEQDHRRMMLLLESFEAFFNLDQLDRFFIVCPPANRALLERMLGNRMVKLNIEIIDENDLCPEFINDPDTSTSWPKVNKGWYRQQLIKLAIYQRVRTAFYMTLDADVIFCRPFALKDLITDGKASLNVQREEDYAHLYKKKWQEGEVKIRIKRYQDAERLLQRERKQEYISRWYGETPVLMSTFLVSHLAEYLEKQWKQPWRDVLLQQLPWNEYPVYFSFVEHEGMIDDFYRTGNINSVLNLESSLWLHQKAYQKKRNINNWENICKENKSKDGVAVVVQSYLGYPIEQVADIARVSFGFNSRGAFFRLFIKKLKINIKKYFAK